MLDPEQIVKLAGIGSNVPKKCEFSPNGDHIAYLWCSENDNLQDLWLYSVRNKTNTLLLSSEFGVCTEASFDFDERMQRERTRETALGITHYFWSNNGEFIIVETGTKLISVSTNEKKSISIYDHQNPIFLTSFSPIGDKLAFVSVNELWLIKISSTGKMQNPAQKLTHDASRKRINGIADQLIWEEFGRQRGFWWLPDNENIVFASTSFDEVPTVYICRSSQLKYDTHYYSFPGSPLAKISLSMVCTTSGEIKELGIHSSNATYFPHITLGSNGHLILFKLARNQTKMEVVEYDPLAAREVNKFLIEQEPWINISGEIRELPHENTFIWLREKENLFRIEKCDKSGRLLCELAAPEGMVHSILDTDVEKGLIYFVASDSDPRQKHIYKSALDGSGSAIRITQDEGSHSAIFHFKSNLWLLISSNIKTPPSVKISEIDQVNFSEIRRIEDARLNSITLQTPEMFEVKLDNKSTTLYGALYKPSQIEKGKKYPLIVSVYGGPHAQAVQNSWQLTSDLRAQHFVQKNYLVLKLDNRGSWGRGKLFETPIYQNLGELEVQDQVDAIQSLLKTRSYVDEKKIAIYGWSYGGYMAAMCILKYPEIFKVAVSGAPVINWEDYDAQYAERYMGVHANDNYTKRLYKKSSVLSYISNLRGRLLVIHGTMDENVLVKHTYALVSKANEKNIEIDTIYLIDERHCVRNYHNKVLVEKKTYQYIHENLEKD